MARRVAVNSLNASTLDILNVIRQNASYEYQSSVPAVTQAVDIPKVGEIIYGTPAFANQFLNALVNRIALVRTQSAVFNNPYSMLKKGYLEFGESIEDIFVQIAQVVEYTPEKGETREFKRTLPDVKSAFHVMNWRVLYPVTIQDEDLKLAFLSIDGVQELIAKIVDSVYTAAEYDEFLLFKYLLIKAISHGKMKPVAFNASDIKNAAIAFRGKSNILPFMSKEYNASAVKTTTPKERQQIFMDADFNAQFDVGVLASAFNMEKADFMGRLHLIDDWTTFDNERFDVIRTNSDGLEEVTSAELTLLQNVKAVLVDENWFQVYDNQNKFTEKYVASGLYWNYFYHVWKTVSCSPFANAIVFVTTSATITDFSTITVKVTDKSQSATSIVLTLEAYGTTDASLKPDNCNFVETSAMVSDGVAMHPFGAIIVPDAKKSTAYALDVAIGNTHYTSQQTGTSPNTVSNKITASSVAVGDTVTLTKYVPS